MIGDVVVATMAIALLSYIVRALCLKKKGDNSPPITNEIFFICAVVVGGLIILFVGLMIFIAIIYSFPPLLLCVPLLGDFRGEQSLWAVRKPIKRV